MKTISLATGVRLHIIQSKKYKEVSIYFNYYQQITRENRVVRSLLAHLLADKTHKYPSKSELAKIKDMLFGVSINASNFSIGEASVVQIGCRLLADKYSNSTNLSDTVALLQEIIENPILDDASLIEAKRDLKDNALRKKDKPMTYAMSRVYSIYGKDSYLELAAILEESAIESVCLDDILDAYQKLSENPLDIFIFGDVNQAQITDLFNSLFKFQNTKPINHHSQLLEQGEFNYIQEYKEVDQCSLIMVYETHTANQSDDYYRLKAANSLLGMVPSSLLFQEVREKNSLCYSINSTILSDEGLLIIKTGIDGKNEAAAIELIKKQVMALKEGDFSLDQLKESLSLYCNLLYGTIDDPSATLNYQYTGLLNKNTMTIDEMIERFNSYTKEDIVQSFAKVELKLIYSLKRDGVNDENNNE